MDSTVGLGRSFVSFDSCFSFCAIIAANRGGGPLLLGFSESNDISIGISIQIDKSLFKIGMKLPEKSALFLSFPIMPVFFQNGSYNCKETSEDLKTR